MNFFLVVLRHSHDDLPLFATTDEDEAMQFAEGVTENSGNIPAKVLGIDRTTPICVCVWLFAGGKLIGNRVVKDLA